LVCPARAWRIQAIAIGPGGITMTNPTTSPTSSAVTMARWGSQPEVSATRVWLWRCTRAEAIVIAVSSLVLSAA